MISSIIQRNFDLWVTMDINTSVVVDGLMLQLQESDIELAKGLVEQDKTEKKILELPMLIETDTLEGRIEGKYRTICIKVPFPILTTICEETV